ncbi:MAG: hypothetical protein R6W73_05535 [Candidatus Saliniplasma sp.]
MFVYAYQIDLIDIYKLNKMCVLIVLVFGIISTTLLIYLDVQNIYPVLLLWILIPVLIKKVVDRFKTHG